MIQAKLRRRSEIVAPFKAVEATSPPAFVHGRDEDIEVEEAEEMVERALYDL